MLIRQYFFSPCAARADEIGHGTKMASVAAGSILDGGSRFRGAAPDSQIVMVKLKQAKEYMKDYYRIPQETVCYQENDIICALFYLQKYAEIFKRPLIICLGIGTNLGDHTGVSFIASYFNELALRRSYGAVICAGNEGATGTHYYGEVEVESGAEFQDVEVRVGDNEEGFMIELWTDTPNLLTVAIKTPVGEMTPEVSFRSPQPSDFSFVYNNSLVRIEYILIEQASGNEVIRMRFTRPQSGIWTIRVFSRGIYGDNTFHMWLPIRQFLRSDTAFLQPTPYTTITSPGFTSSPITISSYNSNNNSFAYTSGRGFGIQGQIKPDLAAPGVNISTILGRESGTSMAAALFAGAMADFYEWAIVDENDVFVNTVSAKNYFVRGASRDSGQIYPNREWGGCVIKMTEPRRFCHLYTTSITMYKLFNCFLFNSLNFI